MKRILDRIPHQIDEVFHSMAGKAAEPANFLRWFFFALFALSALWTRDDDGWATYIFPLMAVIWMVAGLVTRRVSNAGKWVYLDLVIISFGIWLCAWQQVLNTKGTILFICYFPVLALAARQFRTMLVLKAATLAALNYLVVALIAMGSFPLARLLTLGGMAIVALSLAQKPRAELVEYVRKLAADAYDQGAGEKEAELLAGVREHSFPAVQHDLPGLYATYKHAVGSATNGDLYLAVETKKGPFVFVGDLQGKGLSAAMAANRLQDEITRIAHQGQSLVEIASSLNRQLHFEGRTATAVLARWEASQLHYVNAGHLPPIDIVRRETHELPANSPSLGADERAEFVEEVIEFSAGDLLLIYTDGAYLGLASDREHGAIEINRLVREFNGGEVNTICHRVFDCGQPQAGRPSDDGTVVVIRRQEVATGVGG